MRGHLILQVLIPLKLKVLLKMELFTSDYRNIDKRIIIRSTFALKLSGEWGNAVLYIWFISMRTSCPEKTCYAVS